MICVQPKWLGPFSLHQIWWRCPPDISPVTFDHDDLFELPPFGEASSLFSYPVTAMQDHWCNLAFPHGLPRTAAAFRGGRTLVVDLVAQHDPQADTQFVRRCNPRLA